MPLHGLIKKIKWLLPIQMPTSNIFWSATQKTNFQPQQADTKPTTNNHQTNTIEPAINPKYQSTSKNNKINIPMFSGCDGGWKWVKEEDGIHETSSPVLHLRTHIKNDSDYQLPLQYLIDQNLVDFLEKYYRPLYGETLFKMLCNTMLPPTFETDLAWFFLWTPKENLRMAFWVVNNLDFVDQQCSCEKNYTSFPWNLTQLIPQDYLATKDILYLGGEAFSPNKANGIMFGKIVSLITNIHTFSNAKMLLVTQYGKEEAMRNIYLQNNFIPINCVQDKTNESMWTFERRF